MGGRLRLRNAILAILGASVLVLKPAYRGPFEDIVYSYAGNVSVSFALYFAAINATTKHRRPRLAAALATLVAVEAFELTNGFFGALDNVFDPADLVANAVGIGLAILVDAATARLVPSGGNRNGTRPACAEQESGSGSTAGGQMRNRGSFSLVAISCLWALPATAQVTAADFVGTWEHASLESPKEAGGWGPAPVPFTGVLAGVIMYDAVGNMAVQITSDPRGVETPAEQPEIVNGYVAYYGKYEVDSEAGTATHQRRGRVSPALAELRVVR